MRSKEKNIQNDKKPSTPINQEGAGLKCKRLGLQRAVAP